MKKETLDSVRQELRACGISIRSVEGEYQVYPKGLPAYAYYTDDLLDAKHTGLTRASIVNPLRRWLSREGN